MKPFFKIAVSVLIITINLFSQNQKVWFPDNLNIQPFTANVIEPKAGFEFMFSREEI